MSRASERLAMAELGKMAYNAFGEAMRWRHITGARMSTFNELAPELRDAWMAAAKAIVVHDDPHPTVQRLRNGKVKLK